MAERSLDELLPEVRELAKRWIDECHKAGIEMLVYCTYRSPEEQEELFAFGRTKPGRKVTRARGWWSWHNYRRAWDAVPLLFNKPLWKYNDLSAPIFDLSGKIAKKLGISWGGYWSRFKDFLHYEVTSGMTIADAYLLYGPGSQEKDGKTAQG